MELAEQEVVECAGVRCTPAALSEIDGPRVVVSVPRTSARGVTLRHGFQAPSPVLQILLGSALAALGYWPARHLVHWFRHGGTFVSVEAGGIAFAFLGVWMIVTALRRGYFLSVETEQGRKRLEMRGPVSPGELEAFRRGVARVWGMEIQ